MLWSVPALRRRTSSLPLPLGPAGAERLRVPASQQQQQGPIRAMGVTLGSGRRVPAWWMQSAAWWVRNGGGGDGTEHVARVLLLVAEKKHPSLPGDGRDVIRDVLYLVSSPFPPCVRFYV